MNAPRCLWSVKICANSVVDPSQHSQFREVSGHAVCTCSGFRCVIMKSISSLEVTLTRSTEGTRRQGKYHFLIKTKGVPNALVKRREKIDTSKTHTEGGSGDLFCGEEKEQNLSMPGYCLRVDALAGEEMYYHSTKAQREAPRMNPAGAQGGPDHSWNEPFHSWVTCWQTRNGPTFVETRLNLVQIGGCAMKINRLFARLIMSIIGPKLRRVHTHTRVQNQGLKKKKTWAFKVALKGIFSPLLLSRGKNLLVFNKTKKKPSLKCTPIVIKSIILWFFPSLHDWWQSILRGVELHRRKDQVLRLKWRQGYRNHWKTGHYRK